MIVFAFWCVRPTRAACSNHLVYQVVLGLVVLMHDFLAKAVRTRHGLRLPPLGGVSEPHPPSSTYIERRCGGGGKVAESEPLMVMCMALITVTSATGWPSCPSRAGGERSVCR